MCLYINIVSAIRTHWAENENAYPQAIELDQVSMTDFIEDRKVVRRSMAFSITDPGPKIMGVKLVVGDGNVLIAKDGTRVPLV